MSKPRHPFFKKLPTSSKPKSTATNSPKGEKVFVDGILQLKGKFGFVLSEEPKVGDVMVQGPGLRLAMGGDRVRARVTSKPGEPRRSGEITEVLWFIPIRRSLGLSGAWATCRSWFRKMMRQ